MERKIMDVLCIMQSILTDEQLTELKNALNVVFARCEFTERAELQTMDCSWRNDLEDFLISKALEGKSPETVKRYNYELSRLLSYINKAVVDILPSDISTYMRVYKHIKKISNQTLKNVRDLLKLLFIFIGG